MMKLLGLPVAQPQLCPSPGPSCSTARTQLLSLSHGRDWNPAPTVLPPTQLACSPSDVSVGDSLAPPLLSYCHGEKYL